MLNFEKVIPILEILETEGFEAYFAGGCVRDQLMNRLPKDFDVATNARPEEVLNIFTKRGIRVVPTGIDHGTVSLILEQGNVEVTTFRKDLETDGRHATVSYTEATLMDDAERRDFTINALYQDARGKIFDFFEGQKDIEKKILRFVGKPHDRISEDYLRILRLFRFESRLGFSLEKGGLDACKNAAKKLSTISQERITSELLEILAGEYFFNAYTDLLLADIPSVIAPELKNLDADLALRIEGLNLPDPEELKLGRLAILIWGSGGRLLHKKALIQRLRLSRNQQRILLKFGELFDMRKLDKSVVPVLDLIDQCEDLLRTQSFLSFFAPVWMQIFPRESGEWKFIEVCTEIEQKKQHLRLADLPVKANELKTEFSLEEGPILGRILRHLKSQFREKKWRTKEEGISEAKKFLESNSKTSKET